MKILKILGVILVLVAGAFIGYTNFYQKEIVIVDGVKADRPIKLNNDVPVVQKLPQNDGELKEIQIQFGTYKRTNVGVVTVTFLENGRPVQQWLWHAEKLVDNAYQSFTLENPIKLNSEKTYAIKISYHYAGDNFIAVWTNKDAKHGSFKNGDQTLAGSICYRLGYLE
jgi:hypothetical protein